eukprot:scaffold126754_cov24-Tisochrysis_lutea.AAC.1
MSGRTTPCYSAALCHAQRWQPALADERPSSQWLHVVVGPCPWTRRLGGLRAGSPRQWVCCPQ